MEIKEGRVSLESLNPTTDKEGGGAGISLQKKKSKTAVFQWLVRDGMGAWRAFTLMDPRLWVVHV